MYQKELHVHVPHHVAYVHDACAHVVVDVCIM